MNNKQQEIKEEWKDIVIEKNGIIYNYTGIYQVSNMGRIKRLKAYHKSNGEQEHIMSTKIDVNGYEYVMLSKDGCKNGFKTHRLVATMFIPNPDNLPEVNHRDECKTNNYVNNLEWCDRKYNCNYGTRNERQASKIKGREASNETKQKMSEARKGKYNGGNNPNSSKVICIETGVVFNCIKDAQAWAGKTGISACCRGERKTCGGYHWAYYEDINKE